MMQHFLSLPKSLNLDKYFETWDLFNFPLLIKNTLIYTVVSVIGVILFAPPAAYKLARTKTKFSKATLLLVISPIMVPFQTYMITLTKLFSNANLSGTKIGYILVLIGTCMPLAVYMIHGFVKNVPIELEESAYIDGASKIKIYSSIVFPLLKPIITTVIVIDALSIWNDVIINQLLVGSKQNAINIQNAIYMQFSTQNTDWEHALPGIVMSTIPSIIFFIFMQSHLMDGVTEGAIKG